MGVSSFVSDKEILDTIRAQTKKKREFMPALLLFVVSLILFAGGTAFFSRINGMLLIIMLLVLLLHEGGHFLAMRSFGYSDVKIFFLPFFGAATSGKEENPNATREAIVVLAGPVPGIIAGAILLSLSQIFGYGILRAFGAMLLVINLFNLIPLYPLDGGRFLEAVIFLRNNFIEQIFKVIAAVLFLLWAFKRQSVFPALIAFLIFTSLRKDYVSAKVARSLNAALNNEERSSFRLDLRNVKMIREQLNESDPPSLNASCTYLSSVVHGAWKRIVLIPPKLTTSIALISVYCLTLWCGFLSLSNLGFFRHMFR